MQIEIPLKGALSIENIRVNVPSVFTVAIGTDAADDAERGHPPARARRRSQIMQQAEDIIFGQLRQVIASMRIEEINRDREKFLESIQSSLEPELHKIGLVLINVNITDITDESGYIEAIGRKAAAQAIQQAGIDVAEQEKRGAIGVAVGRATSADPGRRRREAPGDRRRRRPSASRRSASPSSRRRSRSASRPPPSSRRPRSRRPSARCASRSPRPTRRPSRARTRRRPRSPRRRPTCGSSRPRPTSSPRRASARPTPPCARPSTPAEAKTAEALSHEDRAGEARRARGRREGREGQADRRRRGHGRADAASRPRARPRRSSRSSRPRPAASTRSSPRRARASSAIVEACGGAAAGLPDAHARAPRPPRRDRRQGDHEHQVRQGDRLGRRRRPTARAATAGFLRSLAGALPPTLQIMRDVGGVQMPDYFGTLLGAPEGTRASTPATSVASPPGGTPTGATPPSVSPPQPPAPPPPPPPKPPPAPPAPPVPPRPDRTR